MAVFARSSTIAARRKVDQTKTVRRLQATNIAMPDGNESVTAIALFEVVGRNACNPVVNRRGVPTLIGTVRL